MRIEEHPWDREAFTLTPTDAEWAVKRRAFPPRLDPVQDRTNAKGDKHYFSSLIHFFEPRPPMEFCAGVNGFFVDQKVNYILLTDAIYAKAPSQKPSA